MATTAHRRRRHALERPLDPSQLVAMGVTGMSVVTFYGVSVRELPRYIQTTVVLLFSAQLAIVVALLLLISCIDPAHPAVKQRQQRNDRQQTQALRNSTSHRCTAASHSPPTTTAIAATMFLDRPTPSRPLKCDYCHVCVSAGTHHCMRCNKCIEGFDHHCTYLNTCIGTRNYPLFIGLLSCTILLVTTQLTVTGFAVARLRSSGSASTAHIVALCCLALLPLLQLVSMLVLATFHLYLWLCGVRTHVWIQRRFGSSSALDSSRTTSTSASIAHDSDDDAVRPEPLDTDAAAGARPTTHTAATASIRSSSGSEQDACDNERLHLV